MKIYRRAAFMELPAGVLFSKGKPWWFDGIYVKGDSINFKDAIGDFGSLNLASIESHDSGELVERFEKMLEEGASFPMEDAYGRDGLFDQDDLFLVWERADLEQLQRIVAGALVVS